MLVPAISDWRSYRGNGYLLWSVCIEDLWFFIPMINFWLILVNVDLTLQNLMVRELLVSRSLFPFPIFDTRKVCQIPFVRVILRSGATFLFFIHLPRVLHWAEMSTDNEFTRRSRTMKHCFMLLRFCDTLKVPRLNVQRALESSGRCKEVEFLNKSTTSAIQELLSAAFQPFVNRNEAPRYEYFWKDECLDTFTELMDLNNLFL